MTVAVTVSELRRNNWRPVRRMAVVAYVLIVAAVFFVDGVPSNRIVLMSLIVSGLSIGSIGHGWGRLRRIMVDWLPFTLVLLVYDISRSLATATRLPLHERDVADVERFLFGGHIPTLWLQHHFYSPGHVHWYDAVATLVYSSHFVATPLLAAILWVRNRQVWISYISRVILLSFAGLITYVLFPEAPPWMAARDHFVSPVERLSSLGWTWLHADHVTDVLSHAQNEGSNPVAAMPSLHTAFAMLIALFVAARLRSRWRHLLFAYPLLMGLTLVYTGEHYVLDIVVGIGYALAVHTVVTRWERNRRQFTDEELPERLSIPVAEATA